MFRQIADRLARAYIKWSEGNPPQEDSSIDEGHDSAESIHWRARRMPTSNGGRTGFIDPREVNHLPSDGMAHPYDEHD